MTDQMGKKGKCSLKSRATGREVKCSEFVSDSGVLSRAKTVTRLSVKQRNVVNCFVHVFHRRNCDYGGKYLKGILLIFHISE